MFQIHLAKEPFKFSCSHFTIFAADRAERLHGHNYQLRVDISVDKIDPNLGLAFDFNDLKPMIRHLCDSLDERILIPTRSPFLKVKTSAEQVEVDFHRKHYVFPLDDTLCLPLVNITSEELARYATEKLSQEMGNLPFWRTLSVHVEETRGQSVSYQISR